MRVHPAAGVLLLAIGAAGAVVLATVVPRLAVAEPPGGEPSGVYFEAERLVSACDGKDAVPVRARITGSNGQPVRNGTPVHLRPGDGVSGVEEPVHGRIEPASTVTAAGYISFAVTLNDVRELEPAVTLAAGDIRATLFFECGDPASAAQPPPGGRTSTASAVQLVLDAPAIVCDGLDAGGLTARFFDHNRRPVSDAYDVTFRNNPQGYFATFDPAQAETQRGRVETEFTFDYAITRAFNTAIIVEGENMRASIAPRCAAGYECDELDTPGGPCPTLTPTRTPSPTRTPGGALCPSSPPAEDPTFRMYVTATEEAGVITARLGIERLDGLTYRAAQWYLCYDGDVLDVLSIDRASAAPADCVTRHDSGTRVLAGCLHGGGALLEYSGDVWIVRFTCTRAAPVTFTLLVGFSATFVNLGVDNNAEITADGSSASCTAVGPRPTPSPTRTPTPVQTQPPFAECTTPVPPSDPPGALYELYVRGEESGGLITLYAGIGDRGGGAYSSAQWHLCFDPAVVDAVGITRVPAAPTYCGSKHDGGTRVLLGCLHTGGSFLEYFGDAWRVDFRCLGAGEAHFWLLDYASLVTHNGTEIAAALTGDSVACTTVGPTPTPTATPTAPN